VKKSGATLPNLIHPKAKIDAFFASNWETIEGNIICSNSVLSCDVNLGNNNLINIATVLSHDTQVGNHNTIMQGCVINGFVRIGNECLFSPGVKVSGSFYFEKDFIKQNLDNY
jgi:UDP-3-O-[3-hydroxymyristoyl] glucosamine N-acyltransferase